MLSVLRKYGEHQQLDFESFSNIVRPSASLIERAVRGQMVIPEFRTFTEEIGEIYNRTLDFKGGKVASYIPQVRAVPIVVLDVVMVECAVLTDVCMCSLDE